MLTIRGAQVVRDYKKALRTVKVVSAINQQPIVLEG